MNFGPKRNFLSYKKNQSLVMLLHINIAKAYMKVVMNAIFEYGLQNDIVNKNYSSFIEIKASDPIIDRILFSRSEIDMLWDMLDNTAARIVLILIYSGMW